MIDLPESFQKSFDEWKKKMAQYKKYTHEELKHFEKVGVSGQVCTCQVEIMNTMTLECVLCGKIQIRFAKAYWRRRLKK